MRSKISENISNFLSEIEVLSVNRLPDVALPQLIAASKTRSAEEIEAAFHAGVSEFGENRVQEMVEKWPAIIQTHPKTRLHFIGQLQTNKVAEVVRYCDMVHTLDRPKLATALNEEAAKQSKIQSCLIQVNTGEEPQKGGALPRDFEELLSYCRALEHLSIEGLMCVPPSDEPAGPHFALLQKMSRDYGLPYLSMGMSSDYQEAIRFGASAIRIGTGIFGPR